MFSMPARRFNAQCDSHVRGANVIVSSIRIHLLPPVISTAKNDQIKKERRCWIPRHLGPMKGVDPNEMLRGAGTERFLFHRNLLFVAEVFTGSPGKYVSLAETIQGFNYTISAGKCFLSCIICRCPSCKQNNYLKYQASNYFFY